MTAKDYLAKSLEKLGRSPAQSEKMANIIAQKSKPRSICEGPETKLKEEK